MNQKLRSVLNWRPGSHSVAAAVWQTPGDELDIGYEAATPYLCSQPGSLDELPPPQRAASTQRNAEPGRS
jgi:hypothetical protein